MTISPAGVSRRVGGWAGVPPTLGLRGTVEDGELSMLMAGRDPRTGRTLREQPVKVAALDLTFSAPKSVSVLHAVADERVSAALVACHEEAVEAALGYLEETAVFVSRRTGAGFERFARGAGSSRRRSGIACRGRWTRSCTPTASRRTWPEGRTGDGRRFTTRVCSARRERRDTCTRPICVRWSASGSDSSGRQVHKGAAELVAIDREVLEEFSRRRHEMRRAADAGGIGLGSKAASQAAALATRSRKQYGIETGSWREEVQARAAEHGLDRVERARVERVALNALEHGPRRQPEGGARVRSVSSAAGWPDRWA